MGRRHMPVKSRKPFRLLESRRPRMAEQPAEFFRAEIETVSGLEHDACAPGISLADEIKHVSAPGKAA